VAKPGLTDQLLRELAPFLAEDGIDANDLAAVPDQATLREALNRAVRRRNTELFSPAGDVREQAVLALRRVVEAICADDTVLAAELVAEIKPESPDNSTATVSACIGLTLRLLDAWLPGGDERVPAQLAERTRLPRGAWVGARAATDILDLASKGRAFQSLPSLISHQGGRHVLYGSALALAAATNAWSAAHAVPVPTLAREVIA
jgi:hypothetical protein